MLKLVTLPAILIIWSASAFADPSRAVVVELGGPRHVTATIMVLDNDYEVTVRMLAVRSFDTATNARLNREKGRRFALEALAKHLYGDKATDVRFTVTGVTIAKAGQEDEFYALTLRVPRRGVSRISEAEQPPTTEGTQESRSKEPVVISSALFTRKQDYLATLKQLTEDLSSDLQEAENKGGRDEDGKALFTAVADLEEHGSDDFDRLAAEAKADLMLLSTEQQELIDAIQNQRRRWTDALANAVKQWEAAHKKEPPK